MGMVAALRRSQCIAMPNLSQDTDHEDELREAFKVVRAAGCNTLQPDVVLLQNCVRWWLCVAHAPEKSACNNNASICCLLQFDKDGNGVISASEVRRMSVGAVHGSAMLVHSRASRMPQRFSTSLLPKLLHHS